MLVIEYDSINGEVVPDGCVREWADKLVETYKGRVVDMTVVIGSVVMIGATRLLVAKKKLNHEEVVYRFGNFGDQSPDKNGMLRTWPEGFCDFYDDILEELIGWSIGGW